MNIFEVKIEWFYDNDNEKTKLNWLCYEFACDFYDAIMKSNKLFRFVKKHSKKDIAKFCEYFSKSIKDNIESKRMTLSEITADCEKHISEYYHRNSETENGYFADAAAEAWEHLMEMCETCSEKCISDPNGYSKYFSRYGGF